ncbi:MAG: DUF4350 domain-containing protein [Thiolinea sp.]
MKWQNLLYAVFAVTLISAGTAWFLQNFELEQVDEFTGYKGEARHNNLFAARLFLKRMGIPAERHDGLVNLPDTDTIILLNTERYSLSTAKTLELMEWVNQGGHLITRARVDIENREDAEATTGSRFGTEDRDHLQDQLGISIGAHQMPDETDLPVLFQPDNSPETLSIELDFFNHLRSEREDAVQYQLGNHTWLIDQPYGKGHVSLLATLTFFENHSLDRADHGKLLWYLLHRHKAEPKQIWLVHQDTLPSLITLLFRHASPLLLALSLLLLFTFWALIPRFGAMIPEPPPQRRRILDHIKASGHFLWKRQQNGRQQLCETMQKRVLQLAKQHLPGWQLLSEKEQYQALADYLQQPAILTENLQHSAQTDNDLNNDKLQQLLSADTLDEADFTRLVQLAQRIRNTT